MARPRKIIDQAAVAAAAEAKAVEKAAKLAEREAAKAAADAEKAAKKAAAGEVVVSGPRHCPAAVRDVWDVTYALNGETFVDKGFASEGVAGLHADRIREVYGL